MDQTKEHQDIAKDTQNRIIELLKVKCSEPDVSASALISLGEFYKKENNLDAAIDYYRQALDKEYSQIKWRIMLARLLAEAGNTPEAIHEAQICLRLSPKYEAAENLIAQLNTISNPITKKD